MSFGIVLASFAQFGDLRLQAVRSGLTSYVAELSDDRQLIQSATYSNLGTAQAWLVESAQAMAGDTPINLNWQRVSAPIGAMSVFFLLSFLLLYGVPTFFELLLLHHVGPLLCMLIGDLASYLVLYFLGRKWIAVTAYLGARVTEILLVQAGLVPLTAMLWVTDAIPSLLCAAILCEKVFFLPRNLSSS